MPRELEKTDPRFWRRSRIVLPNDVRMVLSAADLAAERSAAGLRLCVLVVIGIVLLGLGSIAGMYRGWIATVFALNLAVSAAAVVLARPAVFRSWVPWVVATLDAAVVLGVMMFGDFAERVSTAYTPALAISWAMFLLLALTAMHFRAGLVIYLGGLLVAGLAIAMALDAHHAALAPTDGFGATLELVFGPGHNTIRLSLLALTTLIMAITVARAPDPAEGGCVRPALSQPVAVFPVRAGIAAGRGGCRGVEAWSAPARRHPVRRHPRVHRIVRKLGPCGHREVPGLVSLSGDARDRGAWRHRGQIRRRQCHGRVRCADCHTGGCRECAGGGPCVAG